jgi:CO/xanthine dehydrogenase FAD-binding subunit
VKPAAFEYVAPPDLPSVLGQLLEHGEDAKVLAGGQSLVPLMNFRLVRPRIIVDINRVAGLAYVQERDGHVVIGSLTRHAQLEESSVLSARFPLLADAVPLIGHVAIRSRGTIGGSLAHADPSAELPIVVSALGGRMVARAATGERVIPAAEFFVSYLTTVMAADELLVEIQLPVPPARTGMAFVEVSRRHGDFALVAAAATVTLDADGICAAVSLTLGGVGPTPVLAGHAVTLLLGARPDGRALREVARRAVARLAPDSDLHAQAEYRRELAEVLAERALDVAVHRARAVA